MRQICAIVFLLCGAPLGAAQEHAVRTEPSAVSLRLKGIDQYTSGEWEAARETLARSWEIVPSDRTLAYLILAEVRLGQCDSARARSPYLNVQRLEEMLAAHVRAQFSAGGPCPAADEAGPPIGTKQRCDLAMDVVSDPPDAEVWGFVPGESVGQTYFGRTPLSLDGLCPGDRRFTLKKFGYRPLGRLVTLTPGERAEAKFSLEPYPQAQFLDRFRKYARVGVGAEWISGEMENGESFSTEKAPVLQGHLAMSIWNFWFFGSIGYLPAQVTGGEKLDIVEARGLIEYALPLHRMLPFPTINSTVASANVAVGGSAMGLDRWGAGALVKGGFSILWLSPGVFYYMGTSFGQDAGVSSMWE